MSIRTAVDSIYEKQKELAEELALIRNTCKHRRTAVKNYSWRAGHMAPAILCAKCDEFIAYKDPNDVIMGPGVIEQMEDNDV